MASSWSDREAKTFDRIFAGKILNSRCEESYFFSRGVLEASFVMVFVPTKRLFVIHYAELLVLIFFLSSVCFCFFFESFPFFSLV